jgi:flagellar biosynthesis component FlhA
MRKLAIVGALAAALAWSARANDPEKTQADAQNDMNKAHAEGQQEVSKAKANAQKDVSKAEADAQKKEADARKDAEKKTSDAQYDRSARSDKGWKHPVFGDKDNFDVKGRIQSVNARSITIQRDNLPPAKLDLDRNTRIELNGDRVSATQLRAGEDVKASFNLRNDKPLAVEIKADRK